MVEHYYIEYHGPKMYLFKRYVMTTSATCAASMGNALSYLIATLLAQLQKHDSSEKMTHDSSDKLIMLMFTVKEAQNLQ